MARDVTRSNKTEASGKLQTNIPSNLVSGLKTEWTKRLKDYSPGLWTLSYHLRGVAALDVTATDNGDGTFLVSLTAETSGDTPAPLPTGQYFFQAYVTSIADNTIKTIVDSGRVNVIADLSSGDVETYDGRSDAEKMLAAINDLLAGKATRDQMAYTIGQRTITRIPFDQLRMIRSDLMAQVESEAIKARVKKGLPAFETIKTKFKQP